MKDALTAKMVHFQAEMFLEKTADYNADNIDIILTVA